MKVFLFVSALLFAFSASAEKGVSGCAIVLQQEGSVSTGTHAASTSGLSVEFEHPLWADFQYEFDDTFSKLYEANKKTIDRLIRKQDPFYQFLITYGAEFQGHNHGFGVSEETMAPSMMALVETLNRKKSEGLAVPTLVFPIRIVIDGDLEFKFVEFGKSVTTDGTKIPEGAKIHDLQAGLIDNDVFNEITARGEMPFSGPKPFRQFKKSPHLDYIPLAHDWAHPFIDLAFENAFTYRTEGTKLLVNGRKQLSESELHYFQKKKALDYLEVRLGRFNEWNSVVKPNIKSKAQELLDKLGLKNAVVLHNNKSFFYVDDVIEKVRTMSMRDKASLRKRLVELYDGNMVHYGGAVTDGLLREMNVERFYKKGQIKNIYWAYRNLQDLKIYTGLEAFRRRNEPVDADIDFVLSSSLVALHAFSQFTVDEVLGVAYSLSPDPESTLNFVYSELGIFGENSNRSDMFSY